KRLGDRFRLLAGGRRTAVPRQQTLHALIDWSWDLLTEDDRRLLRRLSVFAGGWTPELAASVVGDADGGADPVELIDGLTRLVDRSLVIVDRGQATTRYHMLETIRQYAREQLAKSDEATTIADRHFATFKALAETAEPELRGPAMGDWLDRLDAEVDNLGAAMEWGLEASPDAAVHMAAALMAYWSSRVASSDVEARILAAIDIARRGASAPGATRDDRVVAARLLGEAARIWAMAGRPDLGLIWAEDAMRFAEASGDVTARVVATSGFAVSCAFTGRGGELKRLYAGVAELAEASGQWWLVAMSTTFAGASSYRDDPEEAEVLVRRGEEAAARSGNPYVLGATSMGRGRVLGLQHRPDEAAAAFQRSIDRFAEIGDTRFALASRSDMAHALRRGGRLEEAASVYRETIGGWVHLGNRGAIANQLENVGYLAVETGRLERAARLLGAAAAIRSTAASSMAYDEVPEYEAYVARVRDGLPSEAFEMAWGEGGRLALNQAVALALAD
ncbi:MAG TPA: hypothetical protein VET90_04320, partial [Candidatus Binatus sp.]|nr:hypothetical protein [Candidatus Binatus sp.]